MNAFWRKDNFKAKNLLPFLQLLLADQLTKWTRKSGKIDNPVIILGCGRSGTSILKESVSAHDRIATYPFEANELWHPRYYPWHESKMDIPPYWVDPVGFCAHTQSQMTDHDEARLRASFGNFQTISGKDHLLLKSAMVSFMVPRLIELIPNLRFIHLVRDGRAVAYSYAKKQHELATRKSEYYGSTEFNQSMDELLISCSHLWQRSIDKMIDVDKELGLTDEGRMLTVRYEDFCEKPEKVSQSIFSWMHLPSDGVNKDAYPNIRSTNAQFERKLESSILESMTHIMKAGLAHHGYQQ